MDPAEYAAAYDKKVRSALGHRYNLTNINLKVLKKCLQMNNNSLTKQEEDCLER